MKASLYIRVRMPDSKYVTSKPAFTAKGLRRHAVEALRAFPWSLRAR